MHWLLGSSGGAGSSRGSESGQVLGGDVEQVGEVVAATVAAVADTASRGRVAAVWDPLAGLGEDLGRDRHRGCESGHDGVPVRVRQGLSGTGGPRQLHHGVGDAAGTGGGTAGTGHDGSPFDPAGSRFSSSISWSRAAARSSRGAARSVVMNCSLSPSPSLSRRFAGTGWRAPGWVARWTACKALMETWA